MSVVGPSLEVCSVFAAALSKVFHAPERVPGRMGKERNDVFPRVTDFSQPPQEKPRCAILYCAGESAFVSAVLSSEEAVEADGCAELLGVWAGGRVPTAGWTAPRGQGPQNRRRWAQLHWSAEGARGCSVAVLVKFVARPVRTNGQVRKFNIVHFFGHDQPPFQSSFAHQEGRLAEGSAFCLPWCPAVCPNAGLPVLKQGLGGLGALSPWRSDSRDPRNTLAVALPIA